MINLTIQLSNDDYHKLLITAQKAGKSVQALINDWITSLPEIDDSYDVSNDPVFQMEGYDSDAPSDFSINIDGYIYGERDVKIANEETKNALEEAKKKRNLTSYENMEQLFEDLDI
jgi:hypothetical protein